MSDFAQGSTVLFLEIDSTWELHPMTSFSSDLHDLYTPSDCCTLMLLQRGEVASIFFP